MARGVSRDHRTRGLALVIVLLMLTMAMPGRSVYSAEVPQMIGDTLESFTSGTLYRTALNSLQGDSPDETGAVQLARSGDLKAWRNSTGVLPEGLSSVGVVALGDRVFVVAGSKTGGTSKDVYWTKVNPDNGNPGNPNDDPEGDDWLLNTELPAILGNDFSSLGGTVDCTAPVAERSGAAVTGFSTGDGGGYIYVMGGSIACDEPGYNVSSYAVQIGVVDSATGEITWSEGPKIPANSMPSLSTSDGLEFAGATTVTTSSGKTYVYLVGGRRTYLSGAFGFPTSETEGAKKVYYAEVNTTTGSLGDWSTAPDIPLTVSGNDVGLWHAAVIGASFDVGGGSVTSREALFVVGGQQKPFEGTPPSDAYNVRMFRADINSGTGALTWDETPGEGDVEVSLPATRVQMDGAAYAGKLYLVGGYDPNQDQYLDSVITAYVKDDLNVLDLDASPSVTDFFINSSDVLPQPRADAPLVIVPATPTQDEPSAAWIYAIAGSNEGANLNNTLYYGKIGGVDENDLNKLVPSGWYYSDPINVQFNATNVAIKKISWTTEIDRASANMDIEPEYRVAVTASGECTGSSISWGDWTAISDADADPNKSDDGDNEYPLDPQPEATCFQYRARFSSSNEQKSPSLLNISLVRILPGSPDLKAETFDADKDGDTLRGLTVTIINENTFESPTQPADYEERARGLSGGDFFVALCISDPGGTLSAPTLPTPRGQNPACTDAYAMINKARLGAGATYTVPSGSWYNSSDKLITNPTIFFTTPGTYQVYLAIDPDNLVNEGDKGGEGNNVVGPLTVVSTGDVDTDSYVYLPITLR